MGEILKAWKGEKVGRVPVWLMRQAGRYLEEYRQVRQSAGGFWELVFDAEKAARVSMQPVERFGVDAVILFADILVVPLSLGVKVEFLKNEGPALEVVRDVAAVEALDVTGCAKVWAPVFETLKILSKGRGDEAALIGFAGSPWTVASYMVEGRGGHDFARIKNWADKDAHGFARLIDVLVEASIAYLDGQIKAGAQAVQLFESWAGVLQGDDFARWVIEPNARIVEALRERHKDVAIIGFPRTNNQDDLLNFVRDVRVDALSIGQDVEARWAAKNLQKHVCVQGNMDPQILLEGGQKMLDEAERICQIFSDGAFVFNLGHGVIKQTPSAHVGALVDCVHAF